MKRPDRHRVLAAALALLLTFPLMAAEPSADVLAVRDQWAQAKYDTPKDQRVAALETLATKAGAARAAHPEAADALIWEGIVLSTLAGEKGGLGALGLVKQAWLQSGTVYGYRKVTDDLREQGEACGKHRVARLMKAIGL